VRRGKLKKAKLLSYEGLLGILNNHDTKDKFDSPGYVPEGTELKKALTRAINPKSLTKQAVLGIDVYRYSQFDLLPQSLVPFVLRLLYSEVCQLLRAGDPYLFHDVDRKLRKHFIDTGDGGFQLLDTPIHALLFALNFETILRAFNSFRFYPRLRKLFDTDLNVRYAITYDRVFTFERNYYGPGIINNSRIIGRDKLNRCLIDQGTFDWFTRNTRGVENLGSIGLQDLHRLPDFEGYDASLATKDGQIFPPKGGFQLLTPWKDIDVLKIGDISVKNDSMPVYSLHMHVMLTLGDEKDQTKKETFTVTLGNLNTSGIADL
jgi:hypothetical protein